MNDETRPERFCVDCASYYGEGGAHYCLRRLSPVTGKRLYLDAMRERTTGECGPDGKHWAEWKRQA